MIASAPEDSKRREVFLYPTEFLFPGTTQWAEQYPSRVAILQNLCRSMYMMHNAITLHLQMNYSSAFKLQSRQAIFFSPFHGLNE